MPDKTSTFSHMDWREIVYKAIETQDLDYKAAVDWNALSRVHKAKFARHVMAMANTRGGTLVIGVGEDKNGNPTEHTGLTREQLRSFDPSTVGQTINNYADPSVDFDIVRPRVDGHDYAIIVVRPFRELPHVCSESCGDELQRGVFYVRTPDAISRCAYRASELHELVQRALRNQRRLLGRMLRGILYEGSQSAEPDAERFFLEQIVRSQAGCRQVIGPRRHRSLPFLELLAFPTEFREDAYSLTDIRNAAATIIVPPLVEFVGFEANEQQAYLTNESFLSKPQSLESGRLFFWELFRTGLFHHLSSLAPAGSAKEIAYPVLADRVATVMIVLGQYYSALGMQDELITFTVALKNAEDCLLTETPNPTPDPLRCFIPEVLVQKRRTVADLASGSDQHALKVIREICERFNFDAGSHVGLRQRLARLFEGDANTPADAA